MGHLTREELVELAEQARPESSVPHLASCETCRADLRELRAVLDAVTLVDVPEPSPLFWDHLTARISEAVAAEAVGETPREAWWTPVLRWRWHMALATGSAAIIIAAVLTIGPQPNQPEVVLGSGVLGAGSGSTVPGSGSGSGVLGADAPGVLELTDLADDPSLSLLAELTEDLDWDAATEAGIAVGTGAADRMADDLDEGERAELQRLLNDALAGTPIGSTSAPTTTGTTRTS